MLGYVVIIAVGILNDRPRIIFQLFFNICKKLGIQDPLMIGPAPCEYRPL